LAKIAGVLKKENIPVFTGKVVEAGNFDLLCISNIFTYYIDRMFNFLDVFLAYNPGCRVVIGGPCVSLMYNYIISLYPNIFLFKSFSKNLENVLPNYDLNWGVDDKWLDYSQLFITRGCPNKCSYCGVSRIEPECWINSNWINQIIPTKRSIMLLDNNIIVHQFLYAQIVETLLRKQINNVELNSGLDCKYVTNDIAKLTSYLPIINKGVRIAFDRIEEDGIFQTAIERLLSAGLKKSQIQAYVLYNFNEKPKEADYRAMECRKFGIRVYPQMFVPLNRLIKYPPYVGRYWTLNLAKAWNFFYSKELYIQMTFDDYITGRATKFSFNKNDIIAWNGDYDRQEIKNDKISKT
jgi:hypothetical protein